MMQEFYDQFHPNVKDVEANAERESGRESWGQILKLESRFRCLGKFGPMAQIGAADDEEKSLLV
jgi:DNA topoisomerase-1